MPLMSRWISQLAIVSHSVLFKFTREKSKRSVSENISFNAAAYLTIAQSGKSTYSAWIIAHRLLCDEGRKVEVMCECTTFIKRKQSEKNVTFLPNC